MEITQPEMYCKTCGALIPDNRDRRDMGEGAREPSLLGCKFCAIRAGGKMPPGRLPRLKLKDLEKAGQEVFDVPVLRIT